MTLGAGLCPSPVLSRWGASFPYPSTMITHYENIPDELRAVPQWVGWKFEETQNSSGEKKLTKVPYNVRTGAKASSTGAKTWCDFDTAECAATAGRFDGIGFVVTEEKGIVGIDLDHCFNPRTGEISDWALEAILLLDTYTEITPSGEGLRCFARGVLPQGGRKKGDIEIYSAGRFLTTTGNALPGYEGRHIEQRNEEIAAFHAKVWPQKDEATAPPSPTIPNDLGDQEILEKAFASKNGARIQQLYNGDWKGAGYSSQSSADSALCYSLAFWTARDPFKIDSLFRSSGLMRPKWDEKRGAQTYGQMTIEKACSGVSQTYSPTQTPVLLRGRAARAHILGKTRQEVEEIAQEVDCESEGQDATDESERAANKGLYAVRYGRTMLKTEKSKQTSEGEKEDGELKLVADLSATIVAENTEEDGASFYQVKGKTRRGRTFDVEMDAQRFNDPKYISSTLKNAAGAGCILYAGMEKHLGPSIDSFTDFDALEYSRRFSRVGWTRDGSEFIIPGREPEDVVIQLRGKLPYEITPGADLEAGLVAFKSLIEAQRVSATTVCLAHILAAPMALPANWRDDKYALFIAGRTGSFKSAWATVAMCIFGPRFAREENLVKFGHGATLNAMMALMVKACDVPFLVDNYKPNTGKGEDDLRNLIHAALEGGEKDRLNRNAQLRESNPIHCWPLFTGEDVPDKDAASLARALVVHFDWLGEENPMLTKVQDESHHLCAIGGAILDWLMLASTTLLLSEMGGKLPARRSAWGKRLRELRSDMVNVNRVASNLAVNELVWEVLCQHPQIGPVLRPYSADHQAGLLEVASNMAQHTAQAFEANRFLDALRSLLSSGRALLLPTSKDPDTDSKVWQIGWADEKGEYLNFHTAFEAASQALRHTGGFGNVTEATIKKQLGQLNILIRTDENDKNRYEIQKRVGTKKTRVLHLRSGTLELSDDDEDEIVDEDED
jgi:primase-polymerase (primpol)-like protein